MSLNKIISIMLIATLTLIGCYKNDYSNDTVEGYVKKIVANKEKKILFKLLDYSNETRIDAGNAIHYYANLYIAYRYYPKEFMELKENKNYSKIIKKVIERGDSYFSDYYEGRKFQDVMKDLGVKEAR